VALYASVCWNCSLPLIGLNTRFLSRCECRRKLFKASVYAVETEEKYNTRKCSVSKGTTVNATWPYMSHENDSCSENHSVPAGCTVILCTNETERQELLTFYATQIFTYFLKRLGHWQVFFPAGSTLNKHDEPADIQKIEDCSVGIKRNNDQR